MAKQEKKEAKPRTRMPDKDPSTAGGPRPRPRSPYADHPPKRQNPLDTREVDDVEHAESAMIEGEWKPEEVRAYGRTGAPRPEDEGKPE